MAKVRTWKRALAVGAVVLIIGWVAWSMAPTANTPSRGSTSSPGRQQTVATVTKQSDGDVELPPYKTGEAQSSSSAETPAEISLTMAKETTDGFPNTVAVQSGDDQIQVTYTGMLTRTRSILFVPVSLYSIASYVEKPEEGETLTLLDGLLEDGQVKVFVLRFLKPLPGSQILNAIREEIDANFEDVDIKSLEKNIENFVQIFAPGSSTGDEVYMTWMPGGRFYCSFKKREQLSLIAEDVPLSRAIWRIWVGEQSGEERLGLVDKFSSPK